MVTKPLDIILGHYQPLPVELLVKVRGAAGIPQVYLYRSISIEEVSPWSPYLDSVRLGR
jgi:hypothetical protein